MAKKQNKPSEKRKRDGEMSRTFNLNVDSFGSGQDLVHGLEITLRASLPQSRHHSKNKGV
jgi:hypothetical protein